MGKMVYVNTYVCVNKIYQLYGFKDKNGYWDKILDGGLIYYDKEFQNFSVYKKVYILQQMERIYNKFYYNQKLINSTLKDLLQNNEQKDLQNQIWDLYQNNKDRNLKEVCDVLKIKLNENEFQSIINSIGNDNEIDEVIISYKEYKKTGV